MKPIVFIDIEVDVTTKKVSDYGAVANDGFQLHTLTELRFFTKIIDEGRKSPVISDALWSRAKERLFSAYRDSTCLPVCRNLIADFEAINQTKYWTDLVEFVKESQMEDFYGDDKETILVSTIHKAKGREFDSVYMLLNGATASTDEERRKLYVGLTRAKNNLYIHYNNDIFRNFQLSGVERIEDATVYPEPTEVILPLTHKGVVLNYFKGREGSSSMLRCGQELCVSGDFLAAEMGGRTINIVKLSKAAAEQLRLLAEKGYRPYKAVVRFVVAWKGEDDQEETLVVLPDVYLKKQGSCT